MKDFIFINEMDDSLIQMNLLIRHEADEILYNKGLFEILKKYGTPHISGSYELDLMTWRDLDLYLESDNIAESTFFELGREIAELFHPVKMSYRNERAGNSPGLPKGLYWGVYLGNEREGAWKIDIWAMVPIELKERLAYSNALKAKLSPLTRERVLEIKSQCWKDPGYRRTFLSTDIYDAVLDKGVCDILEFEKYLKTYVLK